MRNSKGQSLLEVLMVTGLMGVLMVILVSVSTTSINRNQEADRRTVATRLAQEGAEWLRSERDRVGGLQLRQMMTDTALDKSFCLKDAQSEIDVMDLIDTLPENINSVTDNACKVDGYDGIFFRRVRYEFQDPNAGFLGDEYYGVVIEVGWGGNDQEPVTVSTDLYLDI